MCDSQDHYGSTGQIVLVAMSTRELTRDTLYTEVAVLER